MAVVGIDYDEVDPSTYAGVYTYIDDKRVITNTGNPEADMHTVVSMLFERGEGRMIMCSSSVDHFIMDGGDLGVFND